MIRKISLAMVIAVASIEGCATITNKYQSESVTTTQPQSPQNYSLAKQPIVFNTQIDDIQQLDPRIKSVIMYAYLKSASIQIFYYSRDNQRYANKLLELFRNNKVNSVSISQASTTNLIDQNLVKIYLKESQDAETNKSN